VKKMRLNEINEGEAFKEFYGRNIEQMPKLIADGRVPMNTAQLMQRRLDVRGASEDVKSAWMDNYFDTGDAVVYHPDGRVKIVLDSQTLRDMTPETQRVGGALLLTEDAYNTLQGEEFKKGKLGKVNESLSREAVKAHPVWKVLARDQALLNDYTDFIFAEGKERFCCGIAMGVYPSSCGGNNPEMRAWYVRKTLSDESIQCIGGNNPEMRARYVRGLVSKSSASGGGVLDCGDGRFVGIAPEALNFLGKPVGKFEAYTTADLQAFDEAVHGLEAVVKPELLKGIRRLRQKL
jgi:hypothetical protein